MTDYDRRDVIRAGGGLVFAGVIAGCADDDPDEDETDDPIGDDPNGPETNGQEPDEGNGEANENDGNGETDGDESNGETDDSDEQETDETEPADGSEEIEDHLADAPNYDGEISEMTGEDVVRIDVGDPTGETEYVFEPPAVRIDEGTRVVWEWTDTDPHSVTHVDGDFESETETESEFEHTFETTGTYLYYCRAHRDLDQLGAIEVV